VTIPESRAEYFASGAGTPSVTARVVDLNAIERFELVSGIVARAVVGEHCMVNVVEFARGGEAPMHAHGEEQLVLVMEGEVRLELEGESHVLGAGEVAVIPPWSPHSAIGESERAVTIEIFSPPRAALLDLMRAEGRGLATSEG
jgi:quercetin dioxygenase-like cupin family protein